MSVARKIVNPPDVAPSETGQETRASKLKRFFSLSLLENRYPALHGLRLLAIVCVVVSHNNEGLSAAAVELNRRFWLGMDFFFTMSGFLIGSILLHQAGSQKKSGFLRFYARRSFRTFPLYYVTLGLMILRSIRVVGWGESFSIWQIKEFLFLSNYPYAPYHTPFYMPWSWSLSLEEHFYLASPFLVFGLMKLAPKYRVPTLVGLFLLPLAIRIALVGNGADFFVKLFTPTHTRFDPLVLGILIAYLVKGHASSFEKFFSSTARSYTCAALAGLILTGVVMTFSLPLPYSQAPMATPVYAAFLCGTVTSLAYGTLILWAVYSRNRLTEILGSRLCRSIATLGFGIYLIHVPAIGLANRYFHLPWLLTLAVAMVISAGFAYTLHILIEKPLLRLRDRLT